METAAGGYPVHTGIDPNIMEKETKEIGLPRTHGDRPTARDHYIKFDMVTPYTRG
jgi:hypothetical protein